MRVIVDSLLLYLLDEMRVDCRFSPSNIVVRVTDVPDQIFPQFLIFVFKVL